MAFEPVDRRLDDIARDRADVAELLSQDEIGVEPLQDVLKVTGSKIVGSRYLCGGRMQPLDMTIVDADTLEYIGLVRGGTSQTVTLKRIK